MVSNARLDLPDPESPVTTTSLSRGISTEIFLRLCTRAPWTAMVVCAEALAGFRLVVDLEGIRSALEVNERQFLHFNGALPRELHWHGCLADKSLVGQVFAPYSNAAYVEVAPEVVFKLRA